MRLNIILSFLLKNYFQTCLFYLFLTTSVCFISAHFSCYLLLWHASCWHESRSMLWSGCFFIHAKLTKENMWCKLYGCNAGFLIIAAGAPGRDQKSNSSPASTSLDAKDVKSNQLSHDLLMPPKPKPVYQVFLYYHHVIFSPSLYIFLVLVWTICNLVYSALVRRVSSLVWLSFMATRYHKRVRFGEVYNLCVLIELKDGCRDLSALYFLILVFQQNWIKGDTLHVY